MKRLFVGLAVAVIVAARPDLYREKEDFQYSRSSSDEGTKSGYYDAQRGNMGGNYEKAHNMDNLAQHQMGGLVNQVQGELGDGSRTRTGNVFTSASSQGIYGSGRYDLSNLSGRNFQEGVSYENSQAHTDASRAFEAHSTSQNNARYSTNSQSHNSGLRGYQSGNLQEAQNSYGAGEYQRGSQSGHSSRFYTQSGYQGSDYENSNLNQQVASNQFGADTRNRQSQIRILVRPGSSVVVPISAQATHGTHSASYYDQNTANSEAEALNSADLQTAFKPTSNAKHYESSYSYRKQWEKHDVKPEVVPLSKLPVYQIPTNSELYDSDFNTQRQTASSSQIRNQADYSSNQQQSALSSSDSNAYAQSGFNSDNLIGSGSLGSKPKSYQSSYSYHKSWERQGDPYVIKPASNGVYETQTSQRLTDQNQYSSQNYGSRHTKSHQSYPPRDCVIECDPNGHIRVARSAEDIQELNQNTFTGQETQSQYDWQNINAGQETQNNWDSMKDLEQQSQNGWDSLQEFGKQTTNKWDNLETLGEPTQDVGQKLQDFGQQTQNFEQQSLDFGQQKQDFEQQTQDFGQQTQDFGQQSLNFEQNTQDFGQQTQDFGQQTQDLAQQSLNFEQQTQDFGQQAQTFGQQNEWDVGQHTQDSWNNFNGFGQQSESKNEQNADNWEKQELIGQETQRTQPDKQPGQETLNEWNQFEDQNTKIEENHEGTQLTQSSQKTKVSLWDKISGQEQTGTFVDSSIDQNYDKPLQNNQFQVEFNNNYDHNSLSNNQKPLHNLWDKIDDLDDDYIVPINKKEIDTNDNILQTANSQNSQKNWHLDSSEFSPINDSSESVDQKSNSKNFDNYFTNGLMPEKELHQQKSTTENSFIVKPMSSTTNHLVDNHSKDTGRGDIGPEDSLEDEITSTTEKIYLGKDKNNNEGFNYKPQDNPTEKNLDAFEEHNTTPKTQESTTLVESYTHKVKIDKVPEEVGQQFTTQNAQKNTIISDNVNTFHQRATDSDHKNTPLVDFAQNSNDWNLDQQSHSVVVEKKLNPDYNQNTHHLEGKDCKHDIHFLDFGKQSQNEQMDQHHFYHQKHEFVNAHNFQNSDINLEQQNSQSTGKWELQKTHTFQHEHSENSYQQDFHHQHGFHHHGGFNHENIDIENKPSPNDNKYFHNYDKNVDKQNTEWKSFGDKLNNFEQQGIDYFHQQNAEQQQPNLFSQWNLEQQSNMDQFSADFIQQNVEPQKHDKFYNFEEKNVGDLNQLENHEKHFYHENTEQQSVDLNQNWNLEQQKNVDQFPLDLSQGNEQMLQVVPVELNQEEQVVKKENFESFSTNKDINANINEQQVQKHETELPAGESSLPELTTEKPGFWKSIGNKFSSAKNKVASWFGS